MKLFGNIEGDKARKVNREHTLKTKKYMRENILVSYCKNLSQWLT